ncbi:MAG: 50S ribosomal protein L31 [Parcubacteria group bacterium]
MKSEIHPEYHKNATIACVCGNIIKVGSTKEKMEVEICSKCHPFYTGTEKLIDTAGRVERFKARRAKGEAMPKKEKKVRVKKVAAEKVVTKKTSAKKPAAKKTTK